MAGSIKAQERAAVTLTSAGASLTNGSAAAAGTDLDARAGGNAADDFQAQFELTCQWASITTAIGANTVVAELYLVPKLDGTNLPDMDLTAGSSVLPPSTLRAFFTATKSPTAATNARYITDTFPISPRLYTAHILNKSGASNTISANWTLKAVSDQAQYT